jgi:hypothetical protein
MKPFSASILRVLLAVAAALGALAGSLWTSHNLTQAHAAEREQSLAAYQSATGAMELLRADLERAGFVEIDPLKTHVAAVVAHPDPMTITAVNLTTALVLRCQDGNHAVIYTVDGGKLVRTETGAEARSAVLLRNVARAQFQEVKEHDAFNVSFSVRLDNGWGGPAAEAHLFSHFRRAGRL